MHADKTICCIEKTIIMLSHYMYIQSCAIHVQKIKDECTTFDTVEVVAEESTCRLSISEVKHETVITI